MLTTKMDDKSLKKVCLNLNNLSVSWQKMTSVDSLDYVYYENSESDDSVSFLDDFGTTLVIKENTLAKTEFYNELNTLIRKSFDAPDTAIKSSPIKPEVALEQSNNQQLIERINLYNKYCGSSMLNITFERQTDDTLIANGLLKIHWKLSKPIRLENYVEVPVNFISHKDSSVLKMLNNEQNKSSKFISYDDQVIPKEITKNKNNISRANTISYRPKKFERKPILTKTAEENQLFMPAYSSVSNIRIDSSTTCEQAIEILFEKYQISSSPDDYSLYKIQQNGDKKEFEPTELVLLNRIWMGPFNEDKIVIMEKGAVLQVDHQLQTFLSLPLHLLEELVDRLNREEENEITAVQKKYEKYRELLNYRLSLIGEYI